MKNEVNNLPGVEQISAIQGRNRNWREERHANRLEEFDRLLEVSHPLTMQ